MADLPCPPSFSEAEWRRFSPASQRVLALERVCASCGADHGATPIAPGEFCWDGQYYCPNCGPATWEKARQQAAASAPAPTPAPLAPPAAPAGPPPPVPSSANAGRQLAFDFPA